MLVDSDVRRQQMDFYCRRKCYYGLWTCILARSDGLKQKKKKKALLIQKFFSAKLFGKPFVYQIKDMWGDQHAENIISEDPWRPSWVI